MSNKVTALAMRAEPRIDEDYKLAKILVASRMLPKHLTTPEAVFAIVLTGRELGLSALQSTRSIYFVDGKVTLSADLMVALAKRHPDCEYFRVVEASNERCTCETKRAGEEATRMTWTIEDAKAAGLAGKQNWKSYPKAMLRARVSADLCRAVYPDALMGVYEPDEIVERGPGPKRAMPVVVPPHDAETGEVLETQLHASVEAAKSSGKLPEDPEGDDEMGDLALMFAAEIHEAQTEADLYEIGLRIKRASLTDPFSAPLREQVRAKKKAIGVANAANQ